MAVGKFAKTVRQTHRVRAVTVCKLGGSRCRRPAVMVGVIVPWRGVEDAPVHPGPTQAPRLAPSVLPP